jgi:hypothetical protein
MKCPHCATGIAPAFQSLEVAKFEPIMGEGGRCISAGGVWSVMRMRCPECHEAVLMLESRIAGTAARHYIRPKGSVRPIPSEVLDPYKQDFLEACRVLEDSPKASAALSRRCLQAILRDKAGTKSRDLYDQIEEAINSGKMPSHICEGLHAVRVVGNFAAHTMKSTATGEIIDVEPGEAEWNLDVLELLFDFYFVQPAISAKRKAELNAKLKAAGKPELV